MQLFSERIEHVFREHENFEVSESYVELTLMNDDLLFSFAYSLNENVIMSVDIYQKILNEAQHAVVSFCNAENHVDVNDDEINLLRCKIIKLFHFNEYEENIYRNFALSIVKSREKMN